jgi:adenylate cyclase
VRAFVVDLIAVMLLVLYGTEVCPFLDSLGGLAVTANVGAAFLAAHAIGILLRRRLVDRAPPLSRAARTYGLTLARYAAVGVGLTVWDLLVLNIPVGSGVKLVVGTLTLGHFLGVDLALAEERAVMDDLAAEGASLFELERPRSFVRRLIGFALGAVGLAVWVISMLVARDFDALTSTAPEHISAARAAVTGELAFVGGALVLLTVHLVLAFAKNLRRFLDNETRVLESVGRGELDQSVPVASNDEFGVIAAHTNQMIAGLRERRRVREVLGKIVSPDVAKALLDESGLNLGGSRRTVTFLFSDIRDFTSWSEGVEPETLVADLNAYFTEMVRIVHDEGGVVDKFIGDGLMAVFGLDGCDDASRRAVRAALAMMDALEALNPSLTRPIGIGIGVHRGEVVAGNIGSPDRLEFTFIGDAVNTAARIESLTRTLGASILISNATLEGLEDPDRWESRGAHALKGKSEPVEVFSPKGA